MKKSAAEMHGPAAENDGPAAEMCGSHFQDMLNISLRSRQFSSATLADGEAVLMAQSFDAVTDEDLMAELRALEAGSAQAWCLPCRALPSAGFGIWCGVCSQGSGPGGRLSSIS